MDRIVKDIIYDQAIRDAIDRGLEKAAKAITTTLGSKGRNVMYELNWGMPNIIHDGVTIAKEIVLEDPHENMAAQILIGAAQKTNDEAGDGTTTASALVYAIAHEGLRVVSSGTHPETLRKGIEKAVEAVTKELEKMAKPVQTAEEMAQVATISVADPKLGKLVATAIEKVGKNGVVTVQEGTGFDITVEYKEGMEFDKPYISPYLMTNTQRFEAVLKAGNKNDFPMIILYDDTVTNDILIKLLEKAYAYDIRQKVIIIASDFEDVAASSIVLTKIKSKKELVAVKAPDFGDHRTNLLEDMAIVTGGMVIGGKGMQLEQATIDHYGRCEQVIVSDKTTMLIGGKGEKKNIEDRIIALDTMMKNAKTVYEKDKLEGRKAKLVGGVAVINVGAPTEAEMREKKERLNDAVNATKAAVENGIVPGGGVALLRARKVIDTLNLGRFQVGADIVKAALIYPIKILINNAGAEKPDYVVGKIEENANPSFGYNVDTDEYVDLIKSGIIDPLKVSKCALKYAASAATMLLTTQCGIAFKRKTEKTNKPDDEGIGIFTD